MSSLPSAKTDCTTVVVVNKTLTVAAHVVLDQVAPFRGPYLVLNNGATIVAGTWFNMTGSGQFASLLGTGTIQVPQARLENGEISPGLVFDTSACDMCMAGALSLLFGSANSSAYFGDLIFDSQVVYLSSKVNFFVGSNATLANATGRAHPGFPYSTIEIRRLLDATLGGEAPFLEFSGGEPQNYPVGAVAMRWGNLSGTLSTFVASPPATLFFDTQYRFNCFAQCQGINPPGSTVADTCSSVTGGTLSVTLTSTVCPSGNTPQCVHGAYDTNGACVCSAGWGGGGCDVPLCLPACAHGTCQVGAITGDHVCLCDAGWAGADCATALCTLACQSGGVCDALSGVLSCDCAIAPGGNGSFFGPLCGSWAASCAGFPCNNGGVCQMSGGAPICVCPANFRGSTCDMLVCPGYSRTAGTANCFGNGTCVLTGSATACSCSAGYSGADCSTRAATTGGLSTGALLAAILVPTAVLLGVAIAVLVALHRRRQTARYMEDVQGQIKATNLAEMEMYKAVKDTPM